MKLLQERKLSDREKQIYIDAVNESEDLDDLKDLVHEIYWYDKSLFVKINKFPPNRDFEEIKANILKQLGGEEESLKEDITIDNYFKVMDYEPGDSETGIYGDKFYTLAVVKASSEDEALEMLKSILNDSSLTLRDVRRATKEEYEEYMEEYPSYPGESLSEDTIKTKDGKWTNKGKEGTHGKFKTKKEADAQRKAMFANGFKENLKESIHDWPIIIDNTHIQLPISENELIYFIETNFLTKYNIDFIDEVKLVTSGVDEANRKYYNLEVSGFLKRVNKMFRGVPVRVWENGNIEDSRNPLPPVENVIDESLKEDAATDKLQKDIYNFLDELGGYTDYQGRIDALIDEFGLSADDAETYVDDWINTPNSDIDDNSHLDMFSDEEEIDESLLEGLQDIQADFEVARKSWKDLGLEIPFDSALKKWNEESTLAEPSTFFAKPIYDEDAWNDMVDMFMKVQPMHESVDWGYYDKFESINDRYLPSQGEGDNFAQQIVTAVTKLVYKWYNDGDVFDNQGEPRSWAMPCNDLSDYANWLYKYVSAAKPILDSIFDCYSEGEYEDLLQDLADECLDESKLEAWSNEPKKGSIYDCSGNFKLIWDDEENEEDYDRVSDWW